MLYTTPASGGRFMFTRFLGITLGILSALVSRSAVAAESVAVASGPGFTQARQPQAAVAPDGAIHVVFGVGNAVYCASSADSARTFSPAVKIADPGTLALGMRRGP